MADTSLRRSPLHDHHLALGAKCAPFAGWEMPMEYANGGVIAEHTAVRESVGVFDVSHLGKVRVTGPGAAAFVNRCLTNDLDKLTPGQAQYTLCCDPTTGGVIDDLIAYRISDDEIFLVPNAANAAEVVRRLTEAAPEGITVTDEHDRYAVLAVQGPASERVLEAMGLPAAHDYMSFVTAPYEGADVLVCRTGYTGEHGYELIVPTDHAVKVWDALFAEGEPYSIRACGHRQHGGDHRRSARHVGLHLPHALRRLDRHPAGVERDALTDQRDPGPGSAGGGVAQPNQPGRGRRTGPDRQDPAEPTFPQRLLVQHLHRQAGFLRHLGDLHRELWRPEVIGRGVDPVAGPPDRAGDDRGPLQLRGGGRVSGVRDVDRDLLHHRPRARGALVVLEPVGPEVGALGQRPDGRRQPGVVGHR